MCAWKAMHTWNRLPADVTSANSMLTFRRSLKRFFFCSSNHTRTLFTDSFLSRLAVAVPLRPLLTVLMNDWLIDLKQRSNVANDAKYNNPQSYRHADIRISPILTLTLTFWPQGHCMPMTCRGLHLHCNDFARIDSSGRFPFRARTHRHTDSLTLLNGLPMPQRR